MDRESNFTKTEKVLMVSMAIYLVGFMLFGISIIFTPLGDYFVYKISTEKEAFFKLTLVVYMSGTVGSTFYSIRRLYRRMIPLHINVFYQDLFDIKGSFFWFLIRPIQGGVLSLMILSLFNAGFMGISGGDLSKDPLYFQVSLGFLVGYGMHKVLPKIDQIIEVLFSINNSKDEDFRGNRSAK